MNRAVLPPILVSLCLLLSGCYLLKQGTYLLSYNARSRSIDRVLAGGSIGAEEQAMLRTVKEIRRYAVEEIGLAENRNYTRYLETDRDHIVDVVTACAADSFTPHRWRFPLFGAFPYKGYYRAEDAGREAARLERKGLDVWVRKVDGFSTLGFFSDPIYSFMRDYSPFALADLIIHEQTHATLFIKNQVQFNEELATFVGREGALGFLRDRYGADSEAYAQALARLHDWEVFRERVIGLYNRLDRLYGGEAGRAVILEEKRRIVEQFNRRLRAEAPSLFRTGRFRELEGVPANNAYLMSFVRYSRDLELFYRLYEARGRDLAATVEVLKGLENSDGPPKKQLERLVSESTPGDRPGRGIQVPTEPR